MKLRIKRISPSSLALTMGGIYFCIGCVASVWGLLALGTGMNFSFNGWIKISGTGMELSILMMLINPLLDAITGCIIGFLIAVVYNFISPYTMGVIIEADETHYGF